MTNSRKRKSSSSYKAKEYFRGVKSGADKDARTTRVNALPKNKRGLWQKMSIFMLFVGLGALVLLIGYVDSANVEIVDGKSPYEKSSIETRVQAYLDSGPHRRLKPFTSSGGLTDFLQETHPDIDRAEIGYSPFSPNLSVEISMRSPAMIWRNQSGEDLVIDKSGLAYAAFDETVHGELGIVIRDETNPQADINTAVMSSQAVDFIRILDATLRRETDIKSRNYSFPLSARELVLKTADYDIRFSLDRYEEEQVAELKLLLRNLKKRGVTPTDYIDLRVEDRAFYK